MLKEATETLRRAIIGSTFQDLITMLTSKILATTVLLFLAPLASAQDTTTAPKPASATTTAAVPAVAAEFAVFHTNKGDIVIEFNRAKAPISVENFVGYIKDGFFDNTLFHRVVAGFVIQGGGFDTANKQKTTRPRSPTSGRTVSRTTVERCRWRAPPIPTAPPASSSSTSRTTPRSTHPVAALPTRCSERSSWA